MSGSRNGSTRTVRVMFDTMLERWEVSFVDAAPSTDRETRGSVTVARDAVGAPVEVVIDALELSNQQLETIATVFGDDIADLIANLEHNDVDLTVEVTTEIASGGPLSPVAIAKGLVVDKHGSISTELRVEVDRGVMRVRVPGTHGDGFWLTVSARNSGKVLAVAPVRQEGDSAIAEVEFGLPIPLSDLEFTVLRSPFTKRSNHSRVRRTLSFIRVRWLPLIIAVAIGAGLSIYFTTSSSKAPQGAPFPGPTSYLFANSTSVRAAIPGDGHTDSDSRTLTLIVDISVRSIGGYGPPPGTHVAPADIAAVEKSSRQTCLGVTNLPLVGDVNLPDSTLQAVFTAVDLPGDDRPRVVSNPIVIDSRFVLETTVKSSCNEAVLENDMFLAETDFTRETVILEIDATQLTADSRWQIDLYLDNSAGTSELPLIVSVSEK